MSYSKTIRKSRIKNLAKEGRWEEMDGSMHELVRVFNGNLVDMASWLSEIWFDFAIEKNVAQIEQYSQWLISNRLNHVARFPRVDELINIASKDPDFQWLINHNDLQDTWIAGTEIPAPNKEWRTRNKVGNNYARAYQEWLVKQPEKWQERQQLYLARFGNEQLRERSFLYHAIGAYGTPTKEQTRLAALANIPVFDLPRLEEHYPGISSLYTVCEQMGTSQKELQKSLAGFMDEKPTVVPTIALPHGIEPA